MAPVPSTEAVQDPVIIPGNITTMVSATSSPSGERPKAMMMPRVNSASMPLASMIFMKTIAAISTTPTSR